MLPPCKAFIQLGMYFVFHLPEITRGTKKEVLQTQSVIMAIQTPIAPRPKWTHSSQEPKIRQASMEPMPTHMVNFTSLDARRALGNTKETGQKI